MYAMDDTGMEPGDDALRVFAWQIYGAFIHRQFRNRGDTGGGNIF